MNALIIDKMQVVLDKVKTILSFGKEVLDKQSTVWLNVPEASQELCDTIEEMNGVSRCIMKSKVEIEITFIKSH